MRHAVSKYQISFGATAKDFPLWTVLCLAFAVGIVSSISLQAQTFTTLVNFDGHNGSSPGYGALIQGHDGNFYGTTDAGGAYGVGTIFRITPSGELTTLHSFAGYPVEGQYPDSGLVQATDGNFYGTTGSGGNSSGCQFGCGTVFRVNQAGALTTVHNFDVAEGSDSSAVLTQASDGNFYGVNSYGGDLTCDSPNGCGTVFKITPSGMLTVLHLFEGTNGEHPYGRLLQGRDGNLYGTTFEGGANGFPAGYGTVFKITLGGAMTTIYSFCTEIACADGELPEAGLIQLADGNFCGTTSERGANGQGTLFKITPDGALTTLYSFCSQTNCTDGSSPFAEMLLATDGNLYGTTFIGGANGNYGTVFNFTPHGVFTTLHSFANDDGALPFGGLVQATNGTFYGAPSQGGPNNGGTVFSLDMSLGPFVAFVRGYGKRGQTGGILGQGFTGTTAVTLNGTPASFTVVSDTFIKATVPAGATTGYVTVATPTGILTSNVPFHVIP